MGEESEKPRPEGAGHSARMIVATPPRPRISPGRAAFTETAFMSQAEQGFAYSQDHFRQLIEDVLAEAKRLGASDAGAEVSEGSGMSVSVRRGALENVERNRDKSLGI